MPHLKDLFDVQVTVYRGQFSYSKTN